jgi:hypothetical protein
MPWSCLKRSNSDGMSRRVGRGHDRNGWEADISARRFKREPLRVRLKSH